MHTVEQFYKLFFVIQCLDRLFMTWFLRARFLCRSPPNSDVLQELGQLRSQGLSSSHKREWSFFDHSLLWEDQRPWERGWNLGNCYLIRRDLISMVECLAKFLWSPLRIRFCNIDSAKFSIFFKVGDVYWCWLAKWKSHEKNRQPKTQCVFLPAFMTRNGCDRKIVVGQVLMN